MRTIISASNKVFILSALAFGLIFAGAVQAQVGSSISADGTPPNDNAMLDVQSPATGDGKGILIPRVSLAQRTTASAAFAGGLLDDSGNLRGGPAQGLIVYQTDGSQGLYFNTNLTAAPAWVYLGSSTTNYLPLTGGTMSGALNMGAQIVSNVAYIDFSGADVSVGRGANGISYGAALGYLAKGSNSGAAVGWLANGSFVGAALGYAANGANYGAVVGNQANGYSVGAAVGYVANGYSDGAAVGNAANGSDSGAAIGRQAIGTNDGAAVGREADGSDSGAAMGYLADGSDSGAAVGYLANGSTVGAAMGRGAIGNNYGAALGDQANGSVTGAAVGASADGSSGGAAVGASANGYWYGAAMGYLANSSSAGAALGREANGYNLGAAMGAWANGSYFGAAMGDSANGARTNVAIGYRANAQSGTERIAIGHNVTNDVDNSARIRGTLYLDGGTGVMVRASFGGAGAWTAKAFTINHPLDPENKILRHFCLESPQVWNVYAGNVQLVNGQAVVELPDYYSALNLVGSEIYSLTPIGGAFLVGVGQKVQGNRFVIVAKEDGEVSWTIKVLRNDPGCLEDLRRRPVEQMKRDISNSGTAEP